MGSVRVTHGVGTALPGPGRTSQLAHRGHALDTRVAGRRGRVGRFAAALGSSALSLALVAGIGGVVVSGTDERVVFGSGIEVVDGDDTDVEVSLLFGSVTVIVEEGVSVDKGGLVVFGSTTCDAACDGEGTVVGLRALGAFGSVDILTRAEYDADRD